MFFTFYSYKGGVGRSMALANVGKWLSRQGLRVAMIDWDLEAPGLESFFFDGPGVHNVRDQLGLIDTLVSYQRLYPRLRDALAAAASVDDKVKVLEGVLPPLEPTLHALHEMGHEVGEGGALYLLSAGWRADDKFIAYAKAVQDFNWDDFYQEYSGEAYFEWLRRQFLADGLVDLVLVDSRTGVTEMGGVCTRQLADVVVVFSAPNLQNLEGVMSMARDVTRADLEIRRGRPTRVVLVPSRVDNTAPTRVNAFMERFTAEGQDFTPDVFRTLKSNFWALRIPYAPTYAYQERLAICEPDSDKDLEESYKRLAVHLAMLAAPHTRIRRRMTPEIERIFGRLLPGVFVSYAPGDREMAATIRQRLDSANIPVWPDPAESLGPGADWRQTIGSILEQTRFLIVVATPDALRSPEIRQQWRRARELGVAVVPVAPSPLSRDVLGALPGWMQQVAIATPDEWEKIVTVVGGANTATRVPMMAPDLSETFVTRDEIMRRLSEVLLGNVGGRAALFGFPGSGKTGVAAAFCRSDEALTFFQDGIVWVSAARDADPATELQNVYAAITGEQVAFPDARQARAQVESRLAGKRCLVVIDHATTVESLGPYPLEIQGCRFLLTTTDRAVAVRAEAVPIEVGPLTASEAQAIVARVLPDSVRSGADPSLQQWMTTEGTYPVPLRLGAATLAATGVVSDVLVAPEMLKALDEDVLANLDDEGREALIQLAYSPEPMRTADLVTLWQSTPRQAEFLQRLADLALIEGDPERDGVRVRLWARHVIAKRFPDRDVGALYEAAFQRLDSTEQPLAQHVLCRLVRFNETPDGVRTEPREVPDNLFDEGRRRLVDRMEALRMVAVRKPAQDTTTIKWSRLVRLAEPSALRQWTRLRDWVASDQAFLMWRQRLRDYVSDWTRTSDESALLAGVLLEEAQGWLAKRPEDLAASEADYIKRSVAARAQAATMIAPAGASVQKAGSTVPAPNQRVVVVTDATAPAARGSRTLVLAIVTLAVAASMLFVRYVSAPTPAASHPPDPQEQTLQGDLLAERGDLTAAAQAYSGALRQAGDSAALLFKRGTAYCRASVVDKCLADFDRALQLEPGRVEVLAARADARLQKGDLAGALADLDTAIARDPKNAPLYVSRAGVREAVKKNDGAIADYSAAIKLDPSLSTAFFRRAALYEAANDRAGAVADLEKVTVLNADPNSVRAAQARLSRLGATRPVRPPVAVATLVFLQYLDPADEPVLKKVAAAIESGGFKVASIQLVKGGRTTGDVRALPQDAKAAATIEMLAEAALADAGYDVPLSQITLQTPEAKSGHVEVWLPPLSLPVPRPSGALRK